MAIYTCPRCTTPLDLPEDSKGLMVDCPQCGQKLIIPAISAPPPPPGAFQTAPSARLLGTPSRDAAMNGAAGMVVLDVEEETPQTAKPGWSSRLPRSLFFALLGGFGCLLAAMLFEAPFSLLMPAEVKVAFKKEPVIPDVLKVDVAFVLDVTGSMEPQIDGVRQGIGKFIDGLKRQKMDVAVGLVYFRDRIPGGENPRPEDAHELKFDGKPFTGNVELFRRAMAGLQAKDGGDTPESGLDALDYASQLPFRKDAAPVLILITDAPPQVPDKENRDEMQVAEKLKKRKIQQLHLVINENPQRYIALQKILGQKDGKPAGKTYQLNDFAGGRERLERALEDTVPVIGDEVRRQAGIRGLASEGVYETQDIWLLLVVVSLWTAVIALGLAWALIVGTRGYLGRSLLNTAALSKGSLSILAGLLGGAVAQGLVSVMTLGSAADTTNAVIDLIAKLTGWTLMGSLVGIAIALCVPNLSAWRGFLGGGLGGLFGALFYVVFTSLFGALAGRWLGALALGFCVGLMVAIAEVAFRRWWLEVRLGPGEVRTVTLGSAMVAVGSDPLRATIVVPDGPGIALRYYLEGKRVLCEDRFGVSEVEPGDHRQVGNVSIAVCSPETAGHLGLNLELSNGHRVPLSVGLPLTADDLPGLTTSSSDGTLAHIVPTSAGAACLRNRSKQPWTVFQRGSTLTCEPGQAIPLQAGLIVDFGSVQGQFLRPRIRARSMPEKEREQG